MSGNCKKIEAKNFYLMKKDSYKLENTKKKKLKREFAKTKEILKQKL